MTNINKINEKSAFSLVEVLVTLLIISVLMVVMAPVITKKAIPKNKEGIVYTYKTHNQATKEDVCFVTTTSNGTSYTEEYVSTNECSEYTFTVPDGVDKINLTLVAGGGGGGGAAGGKVEKYNVTSPASGSTYAVSTAGNFIADILKSVKINLMVAQGQPGGDASLSSGEKAAGAGGASSPAIVNFDLPKEYMRSLGYESSIVPKTQDIQLNLTSNGSLNIGDGLAGAFSSNKSIVKYTVAYNSYANQHEISCAMADDYYDYKPNADNSQFLNHCKISGSNIIPSVKGQAGAIALVSDMVYVNSYLQGGAGGKIDAINTGYGHGGAGVSAVVSRCPDNNDYWGLSHNVSGAGAQSCKASDATYSKITTSQAGGNGFVDVTYTIERAGGVGGGGAGGTFVRILSVPVSAGEQYVIRVGKGGAGGTGGQSSANPQDGTDGEGGVSTAIYKVSGGKETLLYMVNGGAAGVGGKVWTTGNNGAAGLSGRNFPKLFSSLKLENITLDKTKVTESIYNNDNKPNIEGASNLLVLEYPFLNDEPYKTLNKNTFTSPDGRLGGFSKYDTINLTSVNGYYDGLYFRAIINNYPVYMGGLGGFSGLGTKAGCGGYFLGNPDAKTQNGSTSNNNSKYENIGTIGVDGKRYNVFDYFANCTAITPNGATTPFALPNANASSYGAAGAGGGGGGYGIEMGAGSGADGQNGYLMIDWSR